MFLKWNFNNHDYNLMLFVFSTERRITFNIFNYYRIKMALKKHSQVELNIT